MENRGWKVDHDSWKQMITGFALKSCGFASKKICPTRACTLIDEKNGKWIEYRVLSEFVPHEAIAILGLPLSSTYAEDKLNWAATRNGCCSTKSAYQLLSKEATAKAPGPSTQ